MLDTDRAGLLAQVGELAARHLVPVPSELPARSSGSKALW